MQTVETLIEKLDYLPPEQREDIRRAYYFAEQAHEGQYRRSGDPYIVHPLAVGKILADMHMDAQSVEAALLHDVIEDTHVSKDDVTGAFGAIVADLVDGVSKIGAIKFESKAEAQAENFRKMVLAMTKDIRVILVKLADRLHNMRTLGVLHPTKRRRIALETLEIYAPIANRLGMNNIRVELEDLSFTHMYPMRAARIKKATKTSRGHRKDMISRIQESIDNRLERDGLEGRVIGREKHLYSIYSKMKTQRKPFNEIMDVYGFRIIVGSVDMCYRVLGAIHNLYKPIPGRFKDYIAIPKANGYQSLHTTLIGMNGVPIEIQIRTEEMDAMANNGIAAHWLYKSDPDPAGGAQNRAKEWLKGLLEMQQRAGNSQDFLETVKIDLFPDEVYVFTPKGDILELPTGATPVDFAYAVHTDVGNSCVAARLDHRLVPLSTPIQSGQTIKIITAPGACPNPAWLSFVTTAKARANIRHFLKNQRRSESVSLGHRLLDKALSGFDLALDTIPQERITTALTEAGFRTLDDLLEDIGLGNQMAQIAARRMLPHDEENTDPDSKKPKPLVIRGTEGMVIALAKCCRPIPGDSVMGHLSSGRGMVIHRDNCKNIVTELKENPEKCLSVEWAKDFVGEYNVDLRVQMENERGALASLASLISQADANIETINIKEKDAHLSVVSLRISIRDRKHLAKTIRRMRTLKAVHRIVRVRN
ncbi:MAG: bifunctional GTP diphosphokinase/guanosine-3',5'-bis(diphosphate) 3'-diphosphatase [Pseudomonadales bacterium]|uniref:bifunctional GTP diphosphokinase/guanosine-3',5'-bis pyrophosphate 3'-pyrophosphohydrolase n=1 Tax=unclassified Ketobacter TaxID=2639109 RepID=UPI000C974EFF|nr:MULTISPECIES: bifunctional GTP diphosphokinase/guanosine-3',5'-bis pyrophosphate 3'-pyrophosphohydrolase [unclassified Ketobacter]MAQ27439.1 bifunctional GTP diphosphokinase/guanosine-3',5'-bis(diphosphate) 3'-diphosphatase [Pseudomonadales bacterium]MEC8812389.1 bifunctional GTP diphosphokinase/guanosine-3',5'-bis pyrophosphate 3'-pyrophosphohydrolase [Pseudomonadota bacterium]TNC87225.1 MAG: bifunctional GTP diphosphokinase/guanosine-3',5'-bis(diphosphate) 3'-diphosphatase [Alcanivorax sp.]